MAATQTLLHACPWCSSTTIVSYASPAAFSQAYSCDNCSRVSHGLHQNIDAVPRSVTSSNDAADAELSRLLADTSLAHRPHLWEPSRQTSAQSPAALTQPQAPAPISQQAAPAAAPQIFASAHYTHSAHLRPVRIESGAEVEPYVRHGYGAAAGSSSCGGQWVGNHWRSDDTSARGDVEMSG